MWDCRGQRGEPLLSLGAGESRCPGGKEGGKNGEGGVSSPLCPLGGPGGAEWMEPASVRGKGEAGAGGWRPPPGAGAAVVEERRHHAGDRRGRSGGYGFEGWGKVPAPQRGDTG